MMLVSPAISYLRTALLKLSPRSRDIIVRRYGLKGQTKSLAELRMKYDITTERVRQLAVKGLRSMRQDVQRHCPNYLHVLGGELWPTIAGEDDFLIASDLHMIRRQLAPWFLLALDVCDLALEELLDKYVDRYGNGWIGATWQIDVLHACFLRFERRLQQAALPCALVGIEPREIARVRVAFALNGYRLFGTYVLTAPAKTRVRRALRLHAILACRERIVDIVELTRQYGAQAPLDKCRARNCETAMEAQQQLFIQVMEGCWAGIGQPGEVPSIRGGVTLNDRLSKESETGSSPKRGLQTISGRLEDELRSSGPCSISNLIQRAVGVLPRGRSKSSIARVLNSDKDIFVRLLPGIYALHDQVPTSAQLLLAPPSCMFRKDQVRLYAMARRGGEQWGAYPLWRPESEFLWCMWAREQADEELLGNLLSIAQMDAWASTEDLGAWRKLARRSQFTLQFPPSTGAFVLPPLDRLLAACLYVRQYGRLSWVSGNRILMKSTHAHGSAGLLTLLVALEAVAPDAEDWQGPHKAGRRLNEQIGRLELERVLSASLGWNTRVGQELKKEALAVPPIGWVSLKLVRALFGPTDSHDS
jgi:hypothetical protein